MCFKESYYFWIHSMLWPCISRYEIREYTFHLFWPCFHTLSRWGHRRVESRKHIALMNWNDDYRNCNIYPVLVGMYNGEATLKSSLIIAQKTNMNLSYTNMCSILWSVCSKELKYVKNLYKNVHSSIICKSQKVKATQCLLTDKWKNKIWYNEMEY